MLGELVLYVTALLVGVIIGWFAHDARRRNAKSTDVTRYTVHWDINYVGYDEYYAAVHELDVLVESSLKSLESTTRAAVGVAVGTDRFELDWDPPLSTEF